MPAQVSQTMSRHRETPRSLRSALVVRSRKSEPAAPRLIHGQTWAKANIRPRLTPEVVGSRCLQCIDCDTSGRLAPFLQEVTGFDLERRRAIADLRMQGAHHRGAEHGVL